MQPLTSTIFTMCYFCSWKYHPHIRTTLYVVSILETCTYVAPTLRVRIHSLIHITHPLRKYSTPTLGEDTQQYSLCLFPLKLQLFQLILPTVISALKGLADLKKRKIKERRKKSQKEKKDNQVLIREVCYPQGANVGLDIHHQSSPLIFYHSYHHFIHCTHKHI